MDRMYKILNKNIFIWFVSILLMTNKVGYSYDFIPARTLGLSTSGRGGPLLNDSIMVNPAFISFQNTMSFSGSYLWQRPYFGTPDDLNRAFHVSVIDAKNEYFNAGVAFTRRHDADLVHLALSKKITEAISVGVVGKKFVPKGTAIFTTETRPGSAYDLGASTAFVVPKEFIGMPLQFGITSENLTSSSGKEALGGVKQVGAGGKLGLKDMLTVYVDHVRYFPKQSGSWSNSSLGAELALGLEFFARGGLLGFTEKGWSAGFGWYGPKISIQYGFLTKKKQAARESDHGLTVDIYM